MRAIVVLPLPDSPMIPVKMPDDGDQHRGEHQQHRRADAAENERQHRHAAALDRVAEVPGQRRRQPGEILNRQGLIEAKPFAKRGKILFRYRNGGIDVGIDRIAGRERRFRRSALRRRQVS